MGKDWRAEAEAFEAALKHAEGRIRKLQDEVAISKPCAWCGEMNMAWNASFNGKDICNDCAGDD